MYNTIKENLKRCYVTDKIDHNMLFMTIKNYLLLSSKRNHGINIAKLPDEEEKKIEGPKTYKARRLIYVPHPIPVGVNSYETLLNDLLNKT